MKRHFREAMEWLREQGATDVRFVPCRKHCRIACVYQGESYELVVSGTPSDRNWFKQFQKDLTRLVAQRTEYRNDHTRA